MAVLPITNLSSAASNDYFAEGLVEELTSRIARLELAILLRRP
jgi:TolB-like protein